MRKLAVVASDKEYLAAVQRGDTAELQRMVKEMAEAKGYNVGPVYHGTDHVFRVFKPQFGKPLSFTEDKESLKDSERVMSVFLKAQNPCGKEEYESMMESQLEKAGYDSVHVDGNWLVFSPEQIKSAELVTYRGTKIILLSHRFNKKSKDIRY